MKNIVLTGIMGCGKTTIGRIIAKKLNKKFIDTDEIITNQYGEISSLFDKGEEHFRDIESKVINKLSMLSDCVISTGGGAIKRNTNVINLKKNGVVFFIERDIEKIIESVDTKSRPLLNEGSHKLKKIYKDRIELYKKTADYIIENNFDLINSVNKIIEIYKEK